MASVESGGAPEDWRAAVIAPLYNCKGERTECRNYRGISRLRILGKTSAEILVS